MTADFVITCASQEESYNHALPQLLFPTPLHFQAQAACSAKSLQALMQKSKMPTDQALLQTKKKTKITVKESRQMDAPGIEPVGPWQNQISPRRSPSRTRVTQNLDLSTALTQHIHQWHCPWRCCVCDELFTSISRPCRCSVCECMVHRACCAYELHLGVPRHTIYSTPVCLRCPASSKEKAQRADDKENAQQAERKRTGENQVAAALRKFGHPEEDEETISFTALAAEEEAAAFAAEELEGSHQVIHAQNRSTNLPEDS
jgi:hypothetical protein